MLDIPSMTGIVAAVGVIVGVVFAVVELRNLVKARQTDVVTGLYSTMSSKEVLDAWEKVRDRGEIKDVEEYRKRYGFVEVNMLYMTWMELGVLADMKLVDINLVYKLFSGPIKMVWHWLKPTIEETRKKYNQPQYGWAIENLYNEMQKREQSLQAQQ